jgi:hypothetical protein
VTDTLIIHRCLICRHSVKPEDEQFCATRKTDGGLVCPKCLVLVRINHTDTLRKLANAAAVWWPSTRRKYLMHMFKKKPVILAAMQYLGFNENGAEAEVFLGDAFSCHAPFTDEIDILTPEGTIVIASKGDWLHKGVAGEFYIEKPDIFA